MTETFTPPTLFRSPGLTTPEDPARQVPLNGVPSPDVYDSAQGWLRVYFRSIFGDALEEEAGQAYQVYLRTGSPEQALDYVRNTEGYKTRFPGMAELRAKGRPVNEATYLDLERSYVQIARQFDLPPGFYDSPDDFGRLISGEVSPVEWQRRLTSWQSYERETRDPVAAQQIAEQLAAAGLPAPTDGDFLATVIDPSRSIDAVERRLSAARVGTEAVRSGYGALDTDLSLTLADQGVTGEQARQGFGTLADSTQLFGGLPGESGFDTLDRQQQVGAVFQGDAASLRRIERQRRRRQAEFTGGGGVSTGRTGLAGLGSAG